MPIGLPQHAPWVDRFRRWWADGFAGWRARSGPDAECAFVCELGGPPYPITGPGGAELSDRWAEAREIRRWALESFAATAR